MLSLYCPISSLPHLLGMGLSSMCFRSTLDPLLGFCLFRYWLSHNAAMPYWADVIIPSINNKQTTVRPSSTVHPYSENSYAALPRPPASSPARTRMPRKAPRRPCKPRNRPRLCHPLGQPQKRAVGRLNRSARKVLYPRNSLPSQPLDIRLGLC